MTMSPLQSPIACYPRPGDNDVNGAIIHLSVGRTGANAKMIRKLTEART